MMRRFTKRASAQFAVAIDFSTYPITAGESLVTNGSLGSVGVLVTNQAADDVTAAAVAGAPWISGAQVRFVLKAGLPAGWYEVTAQAPTSDGEMLVDKQALEVLP